MPNARSYPTTDVDLVRQWRDENEKEIAWLMAQIVRKESDVGELKWRKKHRELADERFAEKLAELEQSECNEEAKQT